MTIMRSDLRAESKRAIRGLVLSSRASVAADSSISVAGGSEAFTASTYATVAGLGIGSVLFPSHLDTPTTWEAQNRMPQAPEVALER